MTASFHWPPELERLRVAQYGICQCGENRRVAIKKIQERVWWSWTFCPACEPQDA